MTKIKDLKASLVKNKAKWSVHEALLDDQEIPRRSLGGSKEGLVLPKEVKAIDFKRLFKGQPVNPFILERRIAHGMVPKTYVRKKFSIGTLPDQLPMEGGAPQGGTLPTSVDWRNRWGWPWITTIRDQNGCMACWAFSAVALVEAMVRIEHCVWPWISEGDVHKGMGSLCCNCGNPESPLKWIKNNGAADPGCFPWPITPSGCSQCGGTGGGPYDNITYTPTADRNGRTVKIPEYKLIGSIDEQKKWLDTVGPISTYIEVWTDFFSYGTGVYHKQAMVGNNPNQPEGGHFMLVVGYDDNQGCWIVKNSWGANNWGQGGFGLIGYGECQIDSFAKIGLKGTNPDPWTKRRMHSGCMIESGNGKLHRNFEVLSTAPNGQIRHWWRDNSVSGFPWHQGTKFGNDAKVCPTITGSTFNRNFESVHLTPSHTLHHWWYSQAAGNWNDGGVFGPEDADGVPGFLQSNYNAPGNFEVVVRTMDNKLNHWWRDGNGWHDGGRFGNNIAYSGASLIQSHYGNKGNFELVCVLQTGEMQHWWRDNDHGNVWLQGPTFAEGVKSSPCMIEGQYGALNEMGVGNFELCVAVGGKVQHWWRANFSNMSWHHSDTFGHKIKKVVSLVEGSYGFNLEVVVITTNNKLQHYWRDGNGWHEGPVIGNA